MSITVEVTETTTNVSTVEDVTTLDTALENVLVNVAETTTEIGVAPYIIENNGDVLGGGGFYNLAGNVSIGATTFQIAGTTTGLSIGQFFGLGARSSDCELRRITGISGTTITASSAFERAHTAGDEIYVSMNATFHPLLFGLDGGATDQGTGLQRMLYQCSKNLVNYGPSIDGGDLTYRLSQPLVGSKHTMRNIKLTSTGYTGPIDTNNALFMSSSQTPAPFTATAADNTITSTSGQSVPALNEPVSFNAMYGETLPGGITSGRVYYVKTRTPTTCTLSETVGAAELDITSDGSGWYYGQIGLLTKFWHQNVIVEVNVADLNGMIFGSQQPAELWRPRVNMTAACTRTTYGMLIHQAQICRIYNPEFVVNGADNVIALGIGTATLPSSSAVSVHVEDANFDGASNTGQTHIVIGGASTCDGVVIDGQTHLEGAGDAGIRIDGGRGIYLGPLYATGSPTNGVVYENTTSASWEVEQIHQASSGRILVTTGDGALFKTFGSADSVETESAFTFGGMRRVNGKGPIVKDRVYRSTSSDITMPYSVSLLDVSAAGGNRMIALRSAVGMSGHEAIVRKSEAGANTVTLDPAGSETIGGAATHVLAGGAVRYVRFMSNGANWVITGSG